jgi:hypothetical protein
VVCFDGRPETVEVFWSEKFEAGGRHAETAVCARFPQLIAHYGVPGRASIYLSRSPCHQNHGSKASAAYTTNGTTYGVGCTAKLIRLIQDNPQVGSWRIRFNQYYKPNNDARHARTGEQQIRNLNGTPKPGGGGGVFNVNICEMRLSRDIIFGELWD